MRNLFDAAAPSALGGFVAALVALACVGSDVARAAEAPPFGPGEQSTYRIHFLGVSAGTAQLTVGASSRQWGTDVWPIVAIARSDPKLAFYPIKDRFVTYWDPDEGRTVGSELYADENRKRRRLRVQIDHATGAATVMKQEEGSAPERSEHEVPPGAGDIQAALFAIRSAPLAPGETISVPVFTGTRTFSLEATVEGIETIVTELGPREVFKVRARPDFRGKLEAKRDLISYVTTDPQRLLVRIEAELVVGAIVAELVKYEKGRSR